MDVIFEEYFIKFVTKKAKEMKLTHSDFARKVFPGQSTGTAERVWRQLRSPAPGKPPRRLSLSEAYRMSSALSSEFPALIWQVDQYMKQKQAG
ncbi:hypothetical protein [Maridesulfovibrio zosterae]|uniref:hypothetical protein n=1 Tax=Maridesulfovibrio zosterae TaxID=82171 RepID=UPI00041B1980|nr:hypothetical protein [Maridesulfovibrio zosterae]